MILYECRVVHEFLERYVPDSNNKSHIKGNCDLRYTGMLEPILLEVKLEVRERKTLFGPSTVSRIGSVSFDLRNDDIGHDELPQWHQLVTVEGVNASGMVLVQVRFASLFTLFEETRR